MNRMIWIVCGAAALALAGCSNDNDKSAGVDPKTPFPYATPGAQTMQVDVADLSQPRVIEKSAGICHAATALVVAWVNLNVQVRLLLPEVTLANCLASPSVYVGHSTWTWTATGGEGSNAWTAELTANLPSTTEVGWEMRVSGTTSDLNRFLWFDGISDFDARTGAWTAYDPLTPDAANEVITCAWSLPAGSSEDRTLQFVNVDNRVAEFGDQLDYALADSVASISFFDASANATSAARWDLRDGAGQAVSAEGDTCCRGGRPTYPDLLDCP